MTTLSTDEKLKLKENRPLMAFVAYEDRSEYELGLRLLIVSLSKHHPQIPIHVFCPCASNELQSWCSQDKNNVVLHTKMNFSASGWDIKPYLLKWGLKAGYERVMFLDSDIILSRKMEASFLLSEPETLFTAELQTSARIPTHSRTDAWPHLQRGRSFIRDPSGCCISATKLHLALLEDWIQLLSSEVYQNWQKEAANKRPQAFKGDDELLIALLGSKKYSELKIKFIKNGKHIAQCASPNDYSVGSRLLSIFRGHPALIHSMAKKPWLVAPKDPYYSLVPYTCIARTYVTEVPEDNQVWLEFPDIKRFSWQFLFKENASLATLPHAVLDLIRRFGVRSTFNNIRYKIRGG